MRMPATEERGSTVGVRFGDGSAGWLRTQRNTRMELWQECDTNIILPAMKGGWLCLLENATTTSSGYDGRRGLHARSQRLALTS